MARRCRPNLAGPWGSVTIHGVVHRTRTTRALGLRELRGGVSKLLVDGAVDEALPSDRIRAAMPLPAAGEYQSWVSVNRKSTACPTPG